MQRYWSLWQRLHSNVLACNGRQSDMAMAAAKLAATKEKEWGELLVPRVGVGARDLSLEAIEMLSFNAFISIWCARVFDFKVWFFKTCPKIQRVIRKEKVWESWRDIWWPPWHAWRWGGQGWWAMLINGYLEGHLGRQDTIFSNNCNTSSWHYFMWGKEALLIKSQYMATTFHFCNKYL